MPSIPLTIRSVRVTARWSRERRRERGVWGAPFCVGRGYRFAGWLTWRMRCLCHEVGRYLEHVDGRNGDDV